MDQSDLGHKMALLMVSVRIGGRALPLAWNAQVGAANIGFEGPKELLADNAIQLIFHLAKGIPRVINQLALQAIIRAAVQGSHTIDENFLKQHVLNNSIFDNKLGDI